MKKSTALLLSLFFSFMVLESCKKKKNENPAPSGPSCTNKISKEDITYMSGSSTSHSRDTFYYNSNKMVVEVDYYEDIASSYVKTSFDTIVYKNGKPSQIDSVTSYNVGSPTPSAVNKYTYDGNGRITSVLETGSNKNGNYVRTRTFTYNTSGQLTSMTLTYSTGSPENNDLTGLSNITYTGSNITGATGTIEGTGSQSVTISYNTSLANPHYGLNIDTEDPLALFSPNASTSIVLSGGIPITLNSTTYDINNNGLVSQSRDTQTGGDQLVTEYYYTCY
jgi:YD repeat-containing protein